MIGFSPLCAGDLCCTLTVESASTGTTKAHAHELTLASHSARGSPSSVLEHPVFTGLCCNLSEHETGSSTASTLSLSEMADVVCLQETSSGTPSPTKTKTTPFKVT